MGAVWRHGWKDGGGRASGQAAVQARTAPLQPAPLTQSAGKGARGKKRQKMNVELWFYII